MIEHLNIIHYKWVNNYFISAFGLILMREEVTMVIVDMSYLELCQVFYTHTFTKTHTEDSDFILHAEQNKRKTIKYVRIFREAVKETTGQVWLSLLWSQSLKAVRNLFQARQGNSICFDLK